MQLPSPPTVDVDAALEAVENWDVAISLGLLGLMFVAFALERFSASAIATIGAAAFLALGFVEQEQALAAFSNPAAITIAAMLILSAALVRTGVLEALAERVEQLARSNARMAVIVVLGTTLAASAFMNSTPVVVIMIPLTIRLASTLGVSPKLLLVPLSYCAILGGTCTLLGTSTNLLIDSLLREAGHPGFSIFEISHLGLLVAAAGVLFLVLGTRHLLPRTGSGEPTSVESPPDVLTQVRIQEGFEELGVPYARLKCLGPRGLRAISVMRRGAAVDLGCEDSVATVGDVVNLRATKVELSTLLTFTGLRAGVRVRSERAAQEDTRCITLPSGSEHVGLRASAASYLSRYAVTLLGVRRREHIAGPDLGTLRHKAGDQLWIQGTPREFAAMANDKAFIFSDEVPAKPFLRRRAATAIATLATVVTLAATGAAPLAVAGVVGIGFLFLVRGMDTDDAWSALDMDVLVLIFAMLIVGAGLQNVGAVDAVIGRALPWIEPLPAIGVIACLYLLTSVLTELVTNNAVAVLMTPIALGIADQLGLPPTALIVTVMFAASASFATPIGYQTNTLVYIAGGYRFGEYLRVGVPMNLAIGVVTCAGVGWLYL